MPNWTSLKKEFLQPGNKYRPLQIVHGLDAYLEKSTAFTWDKGAKEQKTPPTQDWQGIDNLFTRLKAGGAGGVVTNIGTGEAYLRDPRQWDILRYGLKRLKELGLTAWIYDEEGYPSGAAGGRVLEGHPEFEALCLACHKRTFVAGEEIIIYPPDALRRFVSAAALPLENGFPRAEEIFDLSSLVDAQGILHAPAPGKNTLVLYFFEKFAYEGTHASTNFWAFRRYVNLLDPQAVRRFIEVTHEAYLRELGAELGGVKAFFTDEPSLMAAYIWSLPENAPEIRVQDPLRFSDRSPMVAWSEQMPVEFNQRKGYNLLERLPHLFMDLDSTSATVRVDFHEVVSQLFAEAYLQQITEWCQAHGVLSSGHVLCEENLHMQATALGADLFTLIQKMSFPGIDMLNSDPQSILAGDSFMVPKQVASAAHLVKRKWVMSESSDFEQRLQGGKANLAQVLGTTNLMYLLGVNFLTLYYDWADMGPDYPIFTTHAARLGSLLTQGKHDARVAVLYPMRGIWERYLPEDQPTYLKNQSPQVQEIVQSWTETCRTLLQNQVDFDCINEEKLLTARLIQGGLQAGNETYQTLVIPPCGELSTPVVARLEKLVAAGGKVVVIQAETLPTDGRLPVEGVENVVVIRSPSQLPAITGQAIPTCIQLEQPNPQILCTRHQLSGAALYFIINNSDEPIQTHARLPVAGYCRLWQPEDGSCTEIGPIARLEPMPLNLPPYGAVIFTFDLEKSP